MRPALKPLVGALVGLAFLAGGLTSCGGEPCDKLAEVEAKADAENNYFKYEDSISSWSAQCSAQYGV